MKVAFTSCRRRRRHSFSSLPWGLCEECERQDDVLRGFDTTAAHRVDKWCAAPCGESVDNSESFWYGGNTPVRFGLHFLRGVPRGTDVELPFGVRAGRVFS